MIILVAEIIAVLAIAAAAFLYFYGKGIADQIHVDFGDQIKTNAAVSHEQTIDEKYTLIMLYGVDARNNKDLLQGANADSEILAVINNETGDVKLVSLHRDTYIEAENGKKNKLTNIYCSYGVAQSVSTVNKMLDLNVTKFVTVNWKAVARTINLIGGLDLELTSKEIRSVNQYGPHTARVTGETYNYLDAEAGVVHLDGIQATAYARTRNAPKDGEDGNTEHDDIARADRQRIVISAMLEKFKKEFSLSLVEDIKEQVLPYVATNIEYDDMLGMVINANKYTVGDKMMFPYEGLYKNQEHNLSTAYIYADTLSDNVKKLHYDIFGVDYTPSSTVEELSEMITEYRHEHS